MWLNEHEIEAALYQTPEDSNLEHGARVLYRLMKWTNEHSDGWPYWQKPSRAANKLGDLLYKAGRDHYATDCTQAELKAAFTPIKAFLTRQGVDHSEVML